MSPAATSSAPSAPALSEAATVALCEDDADIRDLLAAFLLAEGLAVKIASSGAELDRLLDRDPIDLVILDWMLPGEDGLAICRRLRAGGGPPVIMLTARDADADRIEGLDTGADDYLAKPFNPKVLLAHVRAVLRRTAPAAPASNRLLLADLVIETDTRHVTGPGGSAALTAGEFDLLICFASHPQRVIGREQLVEMTRGPVRHLFDRTIDVQVSRLRAKLKAAGSEAAGMIRAVRNAGYILSAPVRRD